MFVITQKTTGKQAASMVQKAVKMRSRREKRKYTVKHFLEDAQLSRNSFWRYKNGDKPEHEGLLKIYAGLKLWDIPVDFQP